MVDAAIANAVRERAENPATSKRDVFFVFMRLPFEAGAFIPASVCRAMPACNRVTEDRRKKFPKSGRVGFSDVHQSKIGLEVGARLV